MTIPVSHLPRCLATMPGDRYACNCGADSQNERAAMLDRAEASDAAVPSHRVGDASLETAEPCPTAYDHGVTCPCPACSAQTAAMRDVARLTHLADHGSTTEQINARAELMRLGLRRRPGLTEEQADAIATDIERALPEGGRLSRSDFTAAIKGAILRAARGELGPTKPGAQ